MGLNRTYVDKHNVCVEFHFLLVWVKGEKDSHFIDSQFTSWSDTLKVKGNLIRITLIWTGLHGLFLTVFLLWFYVRDYFGSYQRITRTENLGKKLLYYPTVLKFTNGKNCFRLSHTTVLTRFHGMTSRFMLLLHILG